jgi:hypothetical protein
MKNKKSKIAGGFTRSQLKDKPTKLTKKKKKTSTDLVVVGPELKIKKTKPGSALVVTKKTVKAIEASFGSHSQAIINMLEMNNNDGGITLLKKRLLQMTINVLPAAEQQLVETNAQKGVYQFATLVSQIRELITDIKADEDRKYIAQSIAEQILKPAFMGLAQDIINDHHDFRRTVEDYIKTEHTKDHSTELRELAKTLANKMSQAYKDVSLKMYETLKN